MENFPTTFKTDSYLKSELFRQGTCRVHRSRRGTGDDAVYGVLPKLSHEAARHLLPLIVQRNVRATGEALAAGRGRPVADKVERHD